MTEQHRATDSEWYRLEAQTCGNKSNVMAYSCILELRDRIKALEAATQSAKPNHPAKPDSSLVERVRQAQGCGNERDARAAIREVAAWIGGHGGAQSAGGWAQRLEQEAGRWAANPNC